MRMADLIPRGWGLDGVKLLSIARRKSRWPFWCRNSFEQRGQTSLGHLTEFLEQKTSKFDVLLMFLDVLAFEPTHFFFK